MIVLTPAAAAQVRIAALQHGDESLALRVAARREGDGSLQYAMGFDHRRDDDRACQDEGVALLVDSESEDLFGGTVLDFVEYEPGDFRFIFVPPPDEVPADPPSACQSGGCSRCRG